MSCQTGVKGVLVVSAFVSANPVTALTVCHHSPVAKTECLWKYNCITKEITKIAHFIEAEALFDFKNHLLTCFLAKFVEKVFCLAVRCLVYFFHFLKPFLKTSQKPGQMNVKK